MPPPLALSPLLMILLSSPLHQRLPHPCRYHLLHQHHHHHPHNLHHELHQHHLLLHRGLLILFVFIILIVLGFPLLLILHPSNLLYYPTLLYKYLLLCHMSRLLSFPLRLRLIPLSHLAINFVIVPRGLVNLRTALAFLDLGNLLASEMILPLRLRSLLLRLFLLLSLARIVRLLLILSGSLLWPRRSMPFNAPVLGILFLYVLMLGLSLVNGSTRSRLGLMVPLSGTRLVLLLVVSSRSMAVAMMRHLLPLLT
uniref:Uncharacterized protein n=1 Tax=Arundo donax TaxID=35708 RepID=A0A0A8YDH3_ARUDO